MRVYIKTDDLTHDSDGQSLAGYKFMRNTMKGESMMIGEKQEDGSVVVKWCKRRYVFRNLNPKHILTYNCHV